MKKAMVAKLAFAGTIGLVAVMASGNADAADCSACHTMHNSQDGIPMRYDTSQTQPLPILLRDSCLGCHSGQNTAGTIATTPPKVNGLSAVAYSGTSGSGANNGSLAGGDFWWVGQLGDNYGHNVNGVDNADGTLTNQAPGGINLAQQLECAGTYGCHGDTSIAAPLSAMTGAHHALHNTLGNSAANIDGSTIGKSFRYLDGVLGYEDSDWQFVEAEDDHNIYYGEIRNTATSAATAGPNRTLSGLCARCHGAFHNTAESNVTDTWGINTSNGDFTAGQWVRHPTDYAVPETVGTEYAAFTTYQEETPVGKSVLANTPTDVTGAQDRIVLCVSCHRAHGSPYEDMLRWSYGTMQVGGGITSGCMNCHTFK